MTGDLIQNHLTLGDLNISYLLQGCCTGLDYTVKVCVWPGAADQITGKEKQRDVAVYYRYV